MLENTKGEADNDRMTMVKANNAGGFTGMTD